MRTNIFKLRQQKVEIQQAAHNLTTKAAGRALTDEEQGRMDRLKLDMANNEAALIEEERHLAVAAGVSLEECAPVPMGGRAANGDTPDWRPKQKLRGRVGCKSVCEQTRDAVLGIKRIDRGFRL